MNGGIGQALASIFLLALLLSACGGGSTESSAPPQNNRAPMVSAGIDQSVDENTNVTLTGSASDDGSIASYVWVQTGGAAVQLNNANSATASFIAPNVNADETLVFTLTATDNDGVSASSSVGVTILFINSLPIVNSVDAPEFVLEGTQYEIEVSASDIEGPIEAYSWEVVNDDFLVVLTQADTPRVSFVVPSISEVQSFNLKVTVTDSDGGEAVSETNIQALPVASDDLRPSVTQFVSTTVIGTDAFTIDWLAVNDDSTPSSLIEYQVHLAEVPSFIPNANTLKRTLTNEYSHTLNGLASSKEYFFKIVAYDLNRNFSWSRENKVILPALAPSISKTPINLASTESLSINSTTKTLEYAANNAPQVEADDFLVIEKDDGLLLQAKQITEQNDKIVVQYEEVTLADVFEDLSLNFTLNLSDEINEQTKQANIKQLTASVSATQPSTHSPNTINWQESGLSIMNNLHASSQRKKTSTSAGTSSVKQATSNAAGSAREIIVSGAATIEGPNFLTTEPNKSLRFSLNSYVTDNFSDYVMSSLTLVRLEHESIQPVQSNYGASFVETINEDGSRRGEFLWQTSDMHIDHQTQKPFIATFRAYAGKCMNIFFNISPCSYKAEIQIPIYVGYFDDPTDDSIQKTIFANDNALIKASAQSSIEFDSEIGVNAIFRNSLLQSAEFSLGGLLSVNAKTLLEATAQDSSSGSIELVNQSFKKIVAVGQVPIVITGNYAVTGVIEASADAEMALSNELDLSLDLQTGLLYDRANGGWSVIQSAEPSFSFTIQGEAEGQAEVTVRLIPELTLRFYGLAAATLKLEPYLFAEAGLQGRFDYAQYLSPDEDINDVDAQYRFTKLDAGIGMDAKMRAGLEAFEKGIIGYPSNDLTEFKQVQVLAKTRIFGLPQITLQETSVDLPFPDSSAIVLRASTEDVPNPFANDRSSLNPFSADSGHWQVFPETGDLSFKQIQEGNRDLVAFSYSVPSVYRLRFVGNSEIGGFVRQYEEFEFDAGDYDNDGIPDIWETRWGITNAEADNDGDGLTNIDEFAYKTIPTNPDSDADGVSDGDEVERGSNPVDDSGQLLPVDFDINEPVLQPVRVIQGELSTPGDIDEYEFELTAGESAHFRVIDSDGTIRPVAWLYNPDGSLHRRYEENDIIIIDCAAGSNGNCTLTQTGTYSLVIADSGSNNTGAYEVQYARVSETNENGALVNDNVVSGDLSIGDLDSFIFSANENESLHIRMTDSDSSIRPVVWLYNPDGTLHRRFEENDVVIIDCAAGSNGNCTLTQSGVYRLVVADSGSNNAGAYEIQYTRVLETNENGALANDGMVSGNLNIGDLDSFFFPANADESLHIRVFDNDNSIRPEVWLYNPDGSLLRRFEENDVVLIDCAAGLNGNCTLTQSGVYKLVIGDSRSTNSGAYNIHYARITESNENGALNNEIALVSEVSIGDLDSFVFNAEENESVNIRVVDVDNRIRPEVWLYNPDGTLNRRFEENDVVSIDCNPGNAGNCTLTQTGLHKIVIADSRSTNAGAYEVIFRGSPQAPLAGNTFVWPLKPQNTTPIVTHDFADYGDVVDNEFHAGLDLVNIDVDDIVYSANAGLVYKVCIEDCQGFGNYIIVQHQGIEFQNRTIYSLYAHLAYNSITVTQGQAIGKGIALGKIGATGAVLGGPHLHFEISTNDDTGNFAYTESHPSQFSYIDPWSYMHSTTIPLIAIKVAEGSNFNVWDNPDENTASVVAELSESQKFAAFAKVTKENGDVWYRIHIPCEQNRRNCAGWIAGKLDDSIYALIDAKAKILSIKQDSVSGASIHADSDANASVIDTIFQSQSFVIKERRLAGYGCEAPWYKIDLPRTVNQLTGWVCGEQIRTSN